MSILTPIPPSVPWYSRAALKTPVVGWIARDVLFGDKDNFWYALVIFLTVWALSIGTWGLVALALPFILSVPFVFFMLILISMG